MWIEREISNLVAQDSDAIQVFRGPRQCGKTSLVLHLDESFQEVSLDDPTWRDLAQRDPELFLSQFKSKIFIDEAQYAPEIFPSLKRRVDLYKRKNRSHCETIIRLTVSNQIFMDRLVKESLAGRAGFFDLGTLSVSEILSHTQVPIQEVIFRGGWPELHAHPEKNVTKYLDDFISSYIEKDIVLTAGIQKSREFLHFLRLLGGRTGTVLDYSILSRQTGVEINTIKSWVSVLEKMQIISLVSPYSHNLSKRLLKSPKIYFLDTGLACRLQGWSESAPILSSPQQGHLFENLVFSEIHKANKNHHLSLQIFHWRSKDGEEVDFLLQFPNQKFLFIESKVSSAAAITPIRNFPEVKKVFKNKIPPCIQCYQEGSKTLERKIPISRLKDYLLSFA